MFKGLVTAVFLAVTAVGCADAPQPPVLQPSSHPPFPLPPIKPALPSTTVQQSAFTDWSQPGGYQ